MPRRPELTDFRRRLRYHEGRWRESGGHPIGSQPIVPRKRKPSRPTGWRLPLAYALEELLDANVLPQRTTRAVRERYLLGVTPIGAPTRRIGRGGSEQLP